MYVLVSYDVSTTTKQGASRLRKIAKVCKDYGQRVQNSVFECKVDPAQYVVFKNTLIKTMNQEEDSLRFYLLGDHWKNRIEHFGIKEICDIEGTLIV